ncbi:hypothetical protein [Desulfonatronovibrio hydrogenovorans]|uniref:hypothetical protein n=1 Tax=Desulfonatronovibrio hydrogenovorans TaxID=53245 RepID=UPI000491371E|nr:hypothetical protein [Desulfonatronovibrio hydrogenovorans]
MKDNKYNIILMRDDTSVRRYRLRPFWLKFMILLFVLLFIGSGAGGYLSFVFFQEKKETAGLYQHQVQLLDDAQRELKRLRNVKEILDGYNEEELRSFLTGNQQQRQSPSPTVDLTDVFEFQDRNIVGVSNVQARFVRGRMRVQLEVNNLVSDQTVSGRVYLFLVRRDGLMVDLNLQDSDLDFAIARFKRVDTTFDLPDILDQDSIFALRVKANDDQGNTLYSETFPMSHILL